MAKDKKFYNDSNNNKTVKRSLFFKLVNRAIYYLTSEARLTFI